MNNYIAFLKSENHVPGYLSIIKIKKDLHHLSVSHNYMNAWIFNSEAEAEKAIAIFCQLNSDYEIDDFEILISTELGKRRRIIDLDSEDVYGDL